MKRDKDHLVKNETYQRDFVTSLNEQTFKTNNLIKANFNGRKKLSRLIFTVGLFVVVPLVLLIGLLISYLVYYPKDNNHLSYKINDQTVAGFAITMCLVTVILAFIVYIFIALRKRVIFDDTKKTWTLVGVGFLASFLDTIGVGSYAVSIGLMKATKTADDDSKFSGTMTVGYCLPQLIEASIFMGAVACEWQTLLILTACSIVGGLIGSWLSNKINSQVFRFVISILMFVVGIVMILVHPNVGVIKATGDAKGFLIGTDRNIPKLIGSIVIFTVLGCLSSLGLGMFAPALASLTLLGMGTTYIFPIMTVAASTMMPPAAIKFIKDKNYLNLHAVIFNMVGGIGSLCSFLVFFVGLQQGAGMDKTTFNDVLKWIATVVVFYSSGLMMYSFIKDYKKSGWSQPKSDPDIL